MLLWKRSGKIICMTTLNQLCFLRHIHGIRPLTWYVRFDCDMSGMWNRTASKSVTFGSIPESSVT